MTGKDAEYCKKCKYHGLMLDETICNYILVERQLRGCPPGVGCTKRKIGNNRKNIEYLKRVVIYK